jgi:hypothetical protein
MASTLPQGIGYWKGLLPNVCTNFIHPASLVDKTWDPGCRSQVIEYLEAGEVFSRDLGYSRCRFGCGISDEEMGSADLSDGAWVWPEGLAHYLRAHQVRPPDEFVASAAANGFKVPRGLDLRRYGGRASMEFWSKFCVGILERERK